MHIAERGHYVVIFSCIRVPQMGEDDGIASCLLFAILFKPNLHLLSSLSNPLVTLEGELHASYADAERD